MRLAIFPGSFDPLTNVHLDIIRRSSPLFDEIVIAVLNNPEKHPLFSVEERCDLIRSILPGAKIDGCGLVVESFSGLTADFARQREAVAIIRGIRAIGDYEYELRMALMNRRLQPEIETGECELIVDSFSGLTADFARKKGAAAIVRGIRAVADYEYELRMALMNRRLEPEIETVFLVAAEEFSYVSSSLMKQVFTLGGRVEGLVPALVEAKMKEKLGN